MEEKKVVLIRKQGTPFTVNYPVDGRNIKYVWNGTKGKILNEKPVPFEVYDWLAQSTTTFTEGELIIKETKDEEVLQIKENIDDIEKVEKSIMTKAEVEAILTSGNHMSLKKKLDEISKELSEDALKSQKRYVISVAGEVGVDSSAKRKILAKWAGLKEESIDLILDKELQESYNEKE